jgi:acetyltransferase-like isoleucine patch superfamily enzyme
MKKKLSLTYRLLRTLGFNYPEDEYGNVSIFRVIKQFFLNIFHAILLSMMNWSILEPFNPRKLRPIYIRLMGAKVGKDVFIGDHVIIDQNRAHLITIEDHVHIAGGTRLLCHKRDLSHYHHGEDYAKLPYKTDKIHLKKGCVIGSNSLIMLGVTIGEGAIVGAFSLVTKDIPEWTVSTGIPAKVVKEIPKR